MNIEKKKKDLRMLWLTTFDVCQSVVKKWKRADETPSASLLAQILAFMREARSAIDLIEKEEMELVRQKSMEEEGPDGDDVTIRYPVGGGGANADDEADLEARIMAVGDKSYDKKAIEKDFETGGVR